MLSTAVRGLERAEVAQLVGNRICELLSQPGPVQTILDHVLASRGKMLRAYLVFLTSHLWEGEPSWETVLDAAAGVELVHLASLIHDDIVDNGEVRRGQITIHRAFGIEQAVLLGDYLFASAFSLFAGTNPQVIRTMGRVIGEMSVGEINELLQPGRSLPEYWRYIHSKTASLLGACCEIGAILAGEDLSWGGFLRELGETVGIAFQLTDDVLDYGGSAQDLGKPIGKDYQAQAWTLPILLATSRGLLNDDWMHLGFSRVQAILTESGILSEVWQLAQDYLSRAQTMLATFPRNTAVVQLDRLLQSLAVRQA